MSGASDYSDIQRVCINAARRVNAPQIRATIKRTDKGKQKADIELIMPEHKITWREVQNIMLEANGKCTTCGKQVWLDGVLDSKDNTWSCVYHSSDNRSVI